jgi:hypothetical protein
MGERLEATVAIQGTDVESVFPLDLMIREVATKPYKRISACAAYATFKGTLLVRSLLLGQNDTQYRG